MRRSDHTVTRVTAHDPAAWLKLIPPERRLQKETSIGGDTEGFVMEAMMDGIGKHAAFYRAYLPHDRSLIPVAVALGGIVALWLSLYLVSDGAKPANRPEGSARCGRARLPTCKPLIRRRRLGSGTGLRDSLEARRSSGDRHFLERRGGDAMLGRDAPRA